ncbi:hypothetical protein [Chromobacterium haemolyticum]|uniref:hypothetical protein n=1 Tax=Chromobacterium haemolyticum TaxID=394935 RepID=UPI0029536FA9|nr:hypothetical protein [Chromobacterium haemolyticum]WON85025.1 hypothetical protein OK026_05835 [Chromobacterium haemolyticum]
MSVGIKGQVMVVVEKVYVVVVWPLLQPVFWAVAKLCFPKRLRDVLVGLMWPILYIFILIMDIIGTRVLADLPGGFFVRNPLL